MGQFGIEGIISANNEPKLAQIDADTKGTLGNLHFQEVQDKDQMLLGLSKDRLSAAFDQGMTQRFAIGQQTIQTQMAVTGQIMTAFLQMRTALRQDEFGFAAKINDSNNHLTETRAKIDGDVKIAKEETRRAFVESSRVDSSNFKV